MVKKYVFTKLNEENLKNLTMKTIRVTRGGKKKKTFTEKDIGELYEQLKEQGYKPNDININVMGITNDFTIKYFNNDSLYDTDDYYRDKVRDESKFDSYDYADVTIKIRKN